MPAGATYNRLHDIIQNVTNFKSGYPYEPCHLFEFDLSKDNKRVTNDDEAYQAHQFYKKNKKLYEERLETLPAESLAFEKNHQEQLKIEVRKPTGLKIDAYLEKYKEIQYLYDFGDSWNFIISLEQVVEDYYFGFPTLLDGAQTAPPEDIGGMPMFYDFLEAYHDLKHPAHEQVCEYAESVDFRVYNPEQINEWLKGIRYKKTQWDQINHEGYKIIQDKYRKSERTKEVVGANKQLSQYIIALTNLYGLVHKEKVLEIYNKQNEEPITLGNVDYYLKIANGELERDFVYTYQDHFVHESILMFDEFDLVQAKKANKPYYVPSQKELLRYSKSSYFEKNQQYKALLAYVKKNFFPQDHQKARWLCEDVHLTSQLNLNIQATLNEFTERGVSFESFDQVNELLALIMDMANNTRIWENNGHTPNEIMTKFERPNLRPLPDIPYQPIKKDKVGRNAPCPCGSGKKYKNCCLGS